MSALGYGMVFLINSFAKTVLNVEIGRRNSRKAITGWGALLS